MPKIKICHLHVTAVLQPLQKYRDFVELSVLPQAEGIFSGWKAVSAMFTCRELQGSWKAPIPPVSIHVQQQMGSLSQTLCGICCHLNQLAQSHQTLM